MTNNPQIQQNWLNTPSFLPCNLPQWGLILIEGPDAASFLQNQLTNSVLGLNRILPGRIAQGENAVRLVGYCSPKGRLLASAWAGLFPASAEGEERYALFISKDIAASIAKRLSMYVLRSKVKVLDLSSEWEIAGLYGTDKQISDFKFNDNCIALRMPDVLVGNQAVARLLVASPKDYLLDSTNTLEALGAWNVLEVLSAIPRIVQATQEQFVPQMINFESVAGVDFKKGCYPGQEIVARSQYRGAIKRRLQLAHLNTNELIDSLAVPGVELFNSKDPSQPAGMVVLSARSLNEPERIDLQIECKLEALEDGEIHLGSAQGPVLKIDLLPYPLIEI
ncbi:folate-binding protein YgfZ [Polynucleobacter sp. JS-Safj-400b-B2]|uniref:CAF17-like 4Fe-4S cluster assembly/insertion protein YgfZ n=1 Tax=Polynucleobacter sp. JS-Safj-400b-B2 TaxID=2576921 RepID=UPI001C0BE524|nr:folate-binding protein [Polynucleobacter sp. JS-Safj-400b-B2]MBU3626664.1 folate-binding protein YgfZ [Polynucleobacter sp. JS-Safj-400b-B2]